MSTLEYFSLHRDEYHINKAVARSGGEAAAEYAREVARLRRDLQEAVHKYKSADGARIAAEQKLAAIANAGHADTCGGINEAEGRCQCGWLQREGAARYIEVLEADRDSWRRVAEKLESEKRAMKAEQKEPKP